MQNHPDKKSNAFSKFLKEKGYYIVLAVCVIAVGVSGYLFVTTAGQAGDQEEVSATLSVPLTPSGDSEKPAEDKSSDAQTGTFVPDDTADDTETAAPSDSVDDAVQTAAATTVLPLSGEIVGEYSVEALAYNQTTRDWRTHDGIDIAAEAGAAVGAARAGVVSAVYEDDALGVTVVVEHEDGYETYYANLDEATAVAAGQSVSAGDVLGVVGDSAGVELSQPSHLHFAVYLDEKPTNPEAFLNS